MGHHDLDLAEIEELLPLLRRQFQELSPGFIAHLVKQQGKPITGARELYHMELETSFEEGLRTQYDRFSSQPQQAWNQTSRRSN